VSHRVRPRVRHHGDRGWGDGPVHFLRPLRGSRVRHSHILGGRTGRPGAHPWGLLGRCDRGLRAAVSGERPASAAPCSGHVRRLLDDRAPAAAGPVRALGGARVRQGSGPRLRRNLTALAVLAVAYLGIAMFVHNSYYQLILTLVPVWALFGVSWNILSGY